MAAIKSTMNNPLLLDGRNVFDPALMAELGWMYSGVGRGMSI
jgi:UDPglucose 6-dehydrogenase